MKNAERDFLQQEDLTGNAMNAEIKLLKIAGQRGKENEPNTNFSDC